MQQMNLLERLLSNSTLASATFWICVPSMRLLFALFLILFEQWKMYRRRLFLLELGNSLMQWHIMRMSSNPNLICDPTSHQSLLDKCTICETDRKKCAIRCAVCQKIVCKYIFYCHLSAMRTIRSINNSGNRFLNGLP